MLYSDEEQAKKESERKRCGRNRDSKRERGGCNQTEVCGVCLCLCVCLCVYMNIYTCNYLREREEVAIRQRRVVCVGVVSTGRGLLSRCRGLVLSHTVEFYSILSASSIRPRI
jgi:hypothetical protein